MGLPAFLFANLAYRAIEIVAGLCRVSLSLAFASATFFVVFQICAARLDIRPSRLALLSLAGIALLLVTPFPALAGNTFVVDQVVDAADANLGDGQCVAQIVGGCTLRAAIQEANVGNGPGEVIVPAGTFFITIPGTDEDAAATGDLDIVGDGNDTLTITGAGVDQTTINGLSVDRVFDVPNGSVTFEVRDLAITGGSGFGGGIRVLRGGTLDVLRVRVDGNQGPQAGGIYANSSFVTIIDSEISNNQATDVLPNTGGGGMRAGSCPGITIERTSIHNNSGVDGQGLYMFDSDLAMSSSTVSDNDAGSGSAVRLESSSSLTLLSSTIEGEVEAVDGGSSVAMACSIVRSCDSGMVLSLGFNLFPPVSGCGPNVLDVVGEPALLPLAGGPGLPPVRMPSASSPALDAGNAGVCAPEDQWQSNPRVVDGDGDGQAVVDIGAIEASEGSPLLADGFESGDTSAWSSTQ